MDRKKRKTSKKKKLSIKKETKWQSIATKDATQAPKRGFDGMS